MGYGRGQPTSFAPNQVIKGWTEAMRLMVEGDKWEMYIPSDLAYGARGSPPKIPGGSALIFRMEIIKKYIKKMSKRTVEQLQKEIARLAKLKARKMRPKLAVWVQKRASILGKIAADKKKEL